MRVEAYPFYKQILQRHPNIPDALLTLLSALYIKMNGLWCQSVCISSSNSCTKVAYANICRRSLRPHSMIIGGMLHHWLSKSQRHVPAIAVPAKYRLPSSFLQHRHRVWHKLRLAALGPISRNSHLHEVTILCPYIPKPLGQTNIIDVPQRHPELVPTVENLERIVPYRARDSSERWWETKTIPRTRTPREIVTILVLRRTTVRPVQVQA